MNRGGMRKKSCALVVFSLCLITVSAFAESLADAPSEKKGNMAGRDKRLALHEHQSKPLIVLKNKQKAKNCPQQRSILSAPESHINMKNPLSAAKKDLLAGQTLFLVDAKPTPCRACHGVAGKGLGIAQMPQTPRNFTCWETMKDVSDGQLFWIIQNGSSDAKMPAYKNLEEDQIWQLILYLRHFVE